MATKSATGGSFNQKRIWLGGGLVLVIAILAIGWFVVIGPVLTETESTRDQIASVQQQNSAIEAKNARLKAENDDVAALRETLVAGLAELPTDSGLPSLTRQLSAQAAVHEVTLTGVIVGASSAVTVDAPVAAVDPAALTSTDGAASVAVVATSGLTQLTITVAASGRGADLAGFLSDIQVAGPRRALVSSAQLSPADGALANGPDTVSTLDLTMTVFSTPTSPDEQAALEKLLSGS